MDGGRGEERRDRRQELNGYRKTPLKGDIMSVGNLYRVNNPTPPSLFFLSLVCNIELFSKRMNVSCKVSFFSFFLAPFFLLMGRNEVQTEGGGTGWFCISHPQLPIP